MNEKIAYSVDTTPWGGTPSAVSVKLLDVTATGQALDVSSASLSGAASVNTNTITTPLVQALTFGHQYHLSIQWTNAGNTFEAYGLITGEL